MGCLYPMPDTLLIVDDDPAARYALTRVFGGQFRLHEAGTVAEAREVLATHRVDLVLLDYSLPGENGLALLREIGAAAEAPAVIMITAHGSERIAVDAMKAGAWDYLAKPYDIEELRLVVARAMERQQLRGEVSVLRERLAGDGDFGRMVGVSPAMRELFVLADRVAQTDLPVLLLGESGTGKDLLAQEIHDRSRRCSQRLVTVNCAALPESLVESELFGYLRGAFTGATANRPGKFELAHRGTLFLDEIGDMTLATQAKILRAAESGAVERLGDSRSLTVDVRIISATNQDIPAAIRQNRFREDLYFRLAGITLRLPALRERTGDVPLLVERFWRQCAQKYGRAGPELGHQVMLRLESAPWPGNVRQLRNAVERLFVLSRGDRVGLDEVDAALGSDRPPPQSDSDFLTAPDFREARRLFEIAYIRRKLREHSGNVTRTADAIGLERQSLQEKLKKLGVERDEAQ